MGSNSNNTSNRTRICEHRVSDFLTHLTPGKSEHRVSDFVICEDCEHSDSDFVPIMNPQMPHTSSMTTQFQNTTTGI